MADADTLERSTLADKITATDIAAYQRDGAVLLRGVLSEDDLKLLERGVEEVHDGPGSGMGWRMQGKDGQGGTSGYQLPSLHNATLREFLDRGIVPEIAARLMQVPSAHYILDQLFYKEAGKVLPTPWHQDTPYMRVRGDDMARIWLTCDPSPRETTVQLVRGSHRWNFFYDTGLANRVDGTEQFRTVDGKQVPYDQVGESNLPKAPDVERYRDSFDIMSWDVEPGDALVFNGNIFHGASGVENHPTRRRAYASVWAGPDVLNHQPEGTKALPSKGELEGLKVPHGARIGDYPDSFPVAWPL